MLDSEFGARLRQFREARGLTLQQVADAVGCTKAYVWELEMRVGQKPTAERLQSIAKLLGVCITDLLGDPVADDLVLAPVDVVFVRQYAALSEPDRARYRQVVALMFRERSDE